MATQPAARTKKDAPKTSHLLKLPAELRNHIYELVFTTDNEDEEKVGVFAASDTAAFDSAHHSHSDSLDTAVTHVSIANIILYVD